MAGTLFGLGLSQQFDVNGDPMSGAKLYVFLADSSTPAITYSSTGLTAGTEHTWPMIADSTGRIPAFWVEDGSYRARLTDASGVPQFDEPNMLAIGPSAGGGGGGDTTDANSVASTGDVKWRPSEGDIPGWVRMNGNTLGSLSSGADYAGADATHKPLFLHIWNNFSNDLCEVTPTRGASAEADWTANRSITLLDMRGRSPFGLDDMGADDSERLDNVDFHEGDRETGGSWGGESFNLINIAQNNLPQINLSHSLTAANHAHAQQGQTVLNLGGAQASIGGGSAVQTGGNTGDSGTLAVSGTVTLNGSSQQSIFHETIAPFMVGTWYWRL